MALEGNVLVVRCDAGLPPLRQQLVTTEPDAVVMEVASHLDARTVRCIALTPTRGLARGASVLDTGGSLEVPVGESLLNVFGEVIDGGGARQRVDHPGSRCRLFRTGPEGCGAPTPRSRSMG